MKKFGSLLLAFVLVFSMCIPVSAAELETDEYDATTIVATEYGNEEGGIQPRVSYNHPIPDFTLISGERAFTTRWGYGFTISNEGYNHDDIDLTFSVNGEAVNLKISLLTMESYSNGNYDITVKTETVTSAGSKTVSFNNLDYGTYVVMWDNIGEKVISITGARLKTSY